ncbi:hypothetical protein [Devosia sp.]|uniref:hypothetical protein n=1 Tax=Devosia sp. TaxID=1871048 RepID=UPI002F0CCD22
MRTCWFVVIESVGRWWVDCEGKTYGPFDREQEARAGAVRIAQAYGDPDRQSVVYAPEASRHHAPIWTGPAPQHQ